MKHTKNEKLTLTVTSMCGNGSGIAHTDDGITVFVADAAEGDRVEATVIKCAKNYLVAKITKIIEPSESRVEPDCEVSGKCGGCVFRHIGYEYEADYKRRLVGDCFSRIGGLDIKLSHFYGADSTVACRNKAIYPVGEVKERDGGVRTVFGFYARNSHRIIPHEKCLIGSPEYTEVCRDTVTFCEKHGIRAYDEESGRGVLRSVYIRGAKNSGDMLLTLVVNAKSLGNSDTESAFCRFITEKHPKVKSVMLNINRKATNAVLSDEWRTLCGDGYIYETLLGCRFRVSPASFFQVNPTMTERLYSEAARLADVRDGETLLDLYCGTGTIGICLCASKPGCRLAGVEISQDAVRDAAYNAAANGVEGEFICLDAGEALNSERVKAVRPDVVILDPPRKGCGVEAVRRICTLGMKRIVYISCDPATLARDLAEFSKLGYAVRDAVGVDMFPRTGHVETVCLLSKLNAKQHIEINLDMDELDLTDAEKKATYQEIKDYVLEHSGLKVSSLYIAQVKQMCGIIERENYNKPKSEDAKQPQCPPEKEKAIREAFKYFGMI